MSNTFHRLFEEADGKFVCMIHLAVEEIDRLNLELYTSQKEKIEAMQEALQDYKAMRAFQKKYIAADQELRAARELAMQYKARAHRAEAIIQELLEVKYG